MSDKQHRLDHQKLNGKHDCLLDTTEGGKCLNRHERRTTNTCSHQWQAFKRAEAEPQPYDWPKYQGMGAGVQVFFQGKTHYAAAPAQGDWDVKAGNFDTSCNTPYFHEAHHIVPNSTLAKAIEAVFGVFTYPVRGGLLDAGYNLNHKSNMILLPLDAAVAAQLKLPRHRILPRMAHPDYSNCVQVELQKYFMTIAAKLAVNLHADLESANSKSYIEGMAEFLFHQIIEAGKDGDMSALDHIPDEWFDQEPPPDVPDVVMGGT